MEVGTKDSFVNVSDFVLFKVGNQHLYCIENRTSYHEHLLCHNDHDGES
jgi:hypothetical protein